jgi:hypothetical protein
MIIQQAIDLQKTMDSDMGGTEILKPLKSIYSNSCKQGYPRQVLLLFCAFVGGEKRKEEENKLKDAILQLHVLASEKRRHRLMILP